MEEYNLQQQQYMEQLQKQLSAMNVQDDVVIKNEFTMEVVQQQLNELEIDNTYANVDEHHQHDEADVDEGTHAAVEEEEKGEGTHETTQTHKKRTRKKKKGTTTESAGGGYNLRSRIKEF